MNKRGGLSTQVVFYIMMSVIMLAIIVFGFSKIFLVDKELSEQDRVEIKNDLKEVLDSCSDPLNKGNKKYFELDSDLFNGVCIIGDNDFDPSRYGNNLISEMSVIADGGANVALVKSKIDDSTSGDFVYDDSDFNIVDYFSVDAGEVSNSFCNWGNEFEITC